jgi:hypothetical protein
MNFATLPTAKVEQQMGENRDVLARMVQSLLSISVVSE